MALSVVNSDVDQIWAGALTDTGFRVQCDLSDPVQSNVVVAAAADTEFSNPVARTAVLPATLTDKQPSGSWYQAKHTVTGLSPNTAYRYAIESNGTRRSGGVSTIKTAPAIGTPAAFSFLLGGDAATTLTDSSAYTSMAAETDALFHINPGDIVYDDSTSTNVAVKRGIFLRAHRNNAAVASLYRQLPIIYTWSDHDAHTDDTSRDDANFDTILANAKTVYQEVFPHYDLTANCGIAQAWSIADVGFIMMDTHTFRRESTNVCLGTTQFDWVVAQFEAMAAAGRGLIFLLSAATWTTSTFLGWKPTWAAEQTALLDAIKAIPGIPGICVLEGDTHQWQADDGGNTDFSTGGGMKIARIRCNPLNQTVNTSGAGNWNGGSQSDANCDRTYCRIDVKASNTGFTAKQMGLAVGAGAGSLTLKHTVATDDLAGW